MQQAILEIIASAAQRDPASLNAGDLLVDIGIDSLRFIMLMLDIERLVGRKIISIDTVGKLEKVGDLLALAGKDE